MTREEADEIARWLGQVKDDAARVNLTAVLLEMSYALGKSQGAATQLTQLVRGAMDAFSKTRSEAASDASGVTSR